MSGGNAGVSNPSTQGISSPADDGWHTAEHGALSAWNGAANVANQVGAFLGLPSWTTEPIQDVVNPKAKKPVSNNKPTLYSTLSDFGNSAGNWLMPAVEGFFKGSTYTDTAHSTGSYLSNVGSAINREGAYATNVVESRFGNQSAIDRLNQMSVQQQQNLSDGAVQNVLKPAIATPAVHVAGKVVNSAFDNVQHMYRAAALAYDKEGLQGALSVLTPAIVGAIVGSLVGNPEIGFASAGLTGESAAAAGESIAAGGIPSTTEGLAAYNVAGRAVTDATTAASEGAATQGPRVVDEQAASKAATAAKIVRGAGSVISKPLGATVKGLGKLTQSTANLGGQIGEQVWYLPGSPEHDYWIKGRVATGDLSTLGRGLSESLGMGKNSWLSGTTDAIVALTEAPQMAGRAAAESNGSVLGQLVSGHSITAVDSTAVDTAYRTNSGVKRTIDEILQMAKDPKRQEDLAGAIVRRYKDLEAIAPDLAKVAQKEGATSWDLVKEIGALADLESYKAIHIPTTGLYGMIKGAKLSDGRISSAFSQFLGQSPMSFSEVQKNITTLSLDFNDKNFGYKLGQLLQQTGMKSSHITRLVSDAVMSTNPAELENVLKRALTENFHQRIDARILQFIGKIDGSKEWQKAFEAGQLTPEQVAFLDERLNAQGIEKVYHGLRESISKAVDNLVTSAPGRDGEYSREGIGGNTDSKLADSTHGALSENQTGHIVLPDYRDFDKQLRELFKTLDRANINDRAQSFNDFLGSKVIDGKYLGVETLDQWVNERFFKPLALLSPGWALRVSLSELTLNTIRLGPINMLASRQTAGMVKTSTKIFAKGQEYGDAHLNNLESYASKLEKKIVKAQTEGDGLKERQVQKELNELRNHIDYLRSPAGTPKGDASNITANQEASKIGSSALNPPDRLTIPDIQKHLADKGYKIPMTAAANLAMIARGVAVGLDQAIITAFGREEFIKNAAFLIYRHGGYLPPSADSRHMLPLSMVDISQPIERVGKRTLRKSAEDEEGNAIRGYKYDTAGKLKTKVVVIGPKPRFKSVNFLGNGYFEGWQYMAATMAGSPLLQRPLAGAYREFVRQGLDGIELRQAAENEARRLIEAMPTNDRMRIARSEIPAMGDEGRSPIDSWAEKLVNNLEATASHPIVASRATLTEEERLQGKTPGVIGYNPNRKLLEDIANNNLPVTVEDFQKEYTRYIENADGVRRPDPLQNPQQVTSRLPRIFGGWDLIGKLSSAGHTKVLGPMVNYMSRQPTYIAEFMAERKALENRVKAGFLNADQADVIAETAAAKNMVLYIHNPADKTKFEEMMRIGAPFYFAQNQAWRRVGRLFADNPGAFMQYAQTMYGVQMLAQQITNKNGMSIVAIPSLMLYGVPFMGSLTSLQTMDPFTTQSDAAGNTDPFASVIEMFKPHPGPLVTLPLEALQAWFPWQQDRIKKTIDPVVGPIGANQSFGQNLFGTFVPNSIARNVIEGVRGYASSNAGSDFTLNSYNNCKLEAFTYTATEMQREEWNKLAKTQFSKNPEEDNRVRRAEFAMWQSKTFGANADSAQQQKFLDQANNRAGLIWAAKLGLGLFSPVALSTGNAEQGLVGKFNNYIKDPKYAGDYNKAVSAFLRDNPYGTLATMYKSKSVRGNTIPETRTAFNYVDKNFDTINQYPYAALAYGPNLSADTKFYYPAYQLELADGLRQRQTPDAFYKSFLIANGNAYYYDAVKPYYEAHKNAPGAYAWKTKQIDNYGNNFNTVWRSNYKLESSIGIHAQALQELNQMMLLPQYRNLPVTKNYEQIMGWVNTILAEAIKQAKSGNVSYQQVQDWWQSKMDAYKKIYPEAIPGIDAVFYNQG